MTKQITGARLEAIDEDDPVLGGKPKDFESALDADAKAQPREIPPFETAITGRVDKVRGAAGQVERNVAEATAEAARRDDERYPDPLRADVRAQIVGPAANQCDEILMVMRAEVAALERAIGAHYTPDVLRRRALFHATDPAIDAAQRLAYAGRISAATPELLVGFAQDAAATGDLARGQALLETIAQRHDDIPREARSEIKRLIEAIPVPGALAAQRAQQEAQRHLADAVETVRVLRGGPPSGRAKIEAGLRARQAAQG